MENTQITLTADQVSTLAVFEWDEPSDQSKYPEYKGWYILADTDNGDFDSEKGAMTDFKLTLYNNEDKLIGTGRGGYYTGVTGMCFNYPVTFTPPKPKKPRKPKVTELETRTIKAMIRYVLDSNIGTECLEGYEKLSDKEAYDGLELLRQRYL